MKRPRTRPARSSALYRAPVLAAVALAASVGVSGCQVMSPIQTAEPYQPADGVAVDLGDVQLRDLLVVAAAKGGVGTLSAMVVNNGTQPVTISFATGANATATSPAFPAGTQSRLSGIEGTAPVTLPSIATAPGGIIRLTVSTPGGGAPVVSVPVLLPEGVYATITPGPSETTAP